MKNHLLTIFILICATGQILAQNTLIDRKGTATFFSEAPLEDIEAKNDEVLGAIDLDKGTLAVSMLIKGFHFDKSLMEEHFNENYLESEKFPKATFKGAIKDYKPSNFSENGNFEAEAEGEIEIHGVKKPLTALVKFNVSQATLKAVTTFELSIAEFDIKIPKLVFKNIAEVVEVEASFSFSNKGL